MYVTGKCCVRLHSDALVDILAMVTRLDVLSLDGSSLEARWYKQQLGCVHENANAANSTTNSDRSLENDHFTTTSSRLASRLSAVCVNVLEQVAESMAPADRKDQAKIEAAIDAFCGQRLSAKDDKMVRSGSAPSSVTCVEFSRC